MPAAPRASKASGPLAEGATHEAPRPAAVAARPRRRGLRRGAGRPGATDAPPPGLPGRRHRAPVEAWYGGEHFVPDAYGGGWCYESRPHRHDFYPDRPDAYVLDGGYYYYRGPLVFTYYEGHPVPGGGWCYARGPHRHEFLPPSGSDFSWRRDRGYVYQGAWRPQRPPPASYWPRGAAPRPASIPAGGSTRPPTRPRAGPRAERVAAGSPRPRRTRPVPRPARPRYDERERRDAAPGYGNLPPGHGGTPARSGDRAAGSRPA